MNLSYLYKYSILLLLVMLANISYAQRVEVITVQHRPAEDIAAQLKDIYPDKQVHVIGHHQQLTIRADDSVIDEIAQLITTLDVPLRQFLISISNDQNANTTNQHWGASGSINSSSGTLGTKNKTQGNTVQITTRSKTYQTQQGSNQSVTVVEGRSAHVNTGQKKPVQSRRFINGQWTNSVEYIDMTSGVYVEPRLIGSNRVELKIRSQRNEASKTQHREINTSTVDTVRIVRLGEWVNIGGASQQASSNQQGISYSTKQKNVDSQSVMIKVDLLP